MVHCSLNLVSYPRTWIHQHQSTRLSQLLLSPNYFFHARTDWIHMEKWLSNLRTGVPPHPTLSLLCRITLIPLCTGPYVALPWIKGSIADTNSYHLVVSPLPFKCPHSNPKDKCVSLGLCCLPLMVYIRNKVMLMRLQGKFYKLKEWNPQHFQMPVGIIIGVSHCGVFVMHLCHCRLRGRARPSRLQSDVWLLLR